VQRQLSRYHVTSPRFVDDRDGIARRVVYATRTAGVRVLDDATWLALAEGRGEELDSAVVDDLAEIELLVPSGEDELATVVGRHDAATERHSVLSLVLCPTAACQLGCDYCGQEHSHKWLSEEHQSAFLRTVDAKLRRRAFESLDICWFGAEPLLAMKVIRAFTPRIRELAQQHGCAYGSRIITNGLALTEKRATELVKQHSIRAIDITLDGVAESHDARRHTKSGRSTFDRIFRNLEAVAKRDDLDVDITLRTNVDASNFGDVSLLIRMLADAGIQRRIGYYIAPIHSWGNDADKASLPPEDFASREIEWLAEMIMHDFKVGLIPPPKPVVCLAVQPEGTLVDADGRLFNCTEAPYVPAYENGRYGIGDVVNGEQPAGRSELADFNRRVAADEYACSTCRMLPVCGGACPKAWLEGSRPCPSALHNMPERLLLAYALSVEGEEPAAATATARL
jgi:uncharacterized protein